MKSVTHRVTSILLYLRSDSQPHLRRRYVTLLMSAWVLCVYNKKGALTQPQPGLCREATPYAVLQPTKQRRPHPRHPVSRSGARSQRLPQEQIHGEADGVRRGPSRTPNRRHRCLLHTLYRLREVPTARFVPNCNWWGEIIRAFFVN